MNKFNIFKHSLQLSMLAVLATACHKEEVVNISTAQTLVGQAITGDTISGAIKGTMLSGRTYYFSTNIVINQGDTVLMQEGTRLIAIGDGTTDHSPQITCNGTFISLGTETNHNFITVPDNQRSIATIGKGIWGGIQCGASSGDLIIKWTHLEFAGGPAGSSFDQAVYTVAGDPRYTLVYTNTNGNFILEDSWIYGSTDDGLRVLHGKISIMRNTFEACGKAGGESVNIKNGTVGDVAYNVSIGAATNAFKVSNSGGGTVQTNVNVYNNTMLNNGFRQVKTGRGGSINYEKGAQGKVYNNMIVNCRFGLRITSDADTAHITYNNQFYYSNDQRQINEFNCTDGVAKTKDKDIRSASPKANNPTFASYDVDQFNYPSATVPMDITAMPTAIITAMSYNFGLLPGSPALKNANADSFQPMKTVPQGGLYGATILAPGVDMGAYQSDGSGNKHYASSLTFK